MSFYLSVSVNNKLKNPANSFTMFVENLKMVTGKVKICPIEYLKS